MKQSFHSNGKLLLSGEYVVLDGALSLAVPTTCGQLLEITPTSTGKLKWQSEDHDDAIWFESDFDLSDIKDLKDATEIGKRLTEILRAARVLNPEFLGNNQGYLVKSKLQFPMNWGLGTSSTLINNLANWAQVDPYELLNRTFGGSGYDIACARHNGPLLYQLVKGSPRVTEIAFDPPFKEQLYFVYLNKKKDSREGIAEYRRRHFDKDLLIKQISEITREMVDSSELRQFELLLNRHETLLSKVLGLPTAKTALFSDYQGAIKSLGAWGGDFVLVTGGDATSDYFNARGYEQVIPYTQMVLSP